jgi:hypothetical protein
MTSQASLVNRWQRGLGAAARRIGAMYDAYRPRTAIDPLAMDHRFLTLPVAFDAPDGGFHAQPHGDVFWNGIFDAAYTVPGDYLKGAQGVFFVAAQMPFLPVVCVRANRTISLSRPVGPARAGVNVYGGLVRSSEEVLLRAWPVSLVVASGRVGHDDVGLPGDGGSGQFTLLLPCLPDGVSTPLASDLVRDDVGGGYVVSAAEQNAMGWRLSLRQVKS